MKSVSIIIPTFNEVKNIPRLLTSLAGQTYQEIEVLIVDDKSSDETVKTAETLGRNLKLNINILAQKTHQERGMVRNIGAKETKRDYLLFIDADMELESNVVSDCISLVTNNSKISGVIIPEVSEGAGFWAECRSLEKRCYIGDDSLEAARFFDTKAFWSIGGWDESMISGEDWDLTNRFRAKYKVARIKSHIHHHEGSLSLKKTIKKKYYYATKAQAYMNKNRTGFWEVITFIIRPAFLRNWRLLLSDPIHAIGMIFLKIIEFAAGAAGILKTKFIL